MKWVNELYVRDENWWEYVPKAGCSWYWRKICEVKECIKDKIREAEILQMADYSVKQIYNTLCGTLERVNWDSLVWNRMTTPKHRFFMWLTMRNKMLTTARLFTIGVSRDPMCLICGLAEETQDH